MVRLAATSLLVRGVRTEDDVRRCLQELYDVFAAHGWGQATFEVSTEGAPATLWVKHTEGSAVDPDVVNAAVRRAGGYEVVAAPEHAV